jgi:hypothetical protein
MDFHRFKGGVNSVLREMASRAAPGTRLADKRQQDIVDRHPHSPLSITIKAGAPRLLIFIKTTIPSNSWPRHAFD